MRFHQPFLDTGRKVFDLFQGYAAVQREHFGQILELANLLPGAEAAHVDVARLVVMGNPYREIVQAADAEKVDLIVMATHGRTGLSHLVMGSVAERVVRTASCPVLTVRPTV